jgi:hypothetical protein
LGPLVISIPSDHNVPTGEKIKRGRKAMELKQSNDTQEVVTTPESRVDAFDRVK